MSKVNLDESLPSEIVKEWTKIEQDTNECTQLEFPRCYFNKYSENKGTNLHIVTIAST